MILTFTDFGWNGPYMGELRAALRRTAPEVPTIDLMADAPAFRPDLASCLLAALAPTARTGDVVLAVVDPGVGGPRKALAVEVDGRWFVGPDNGLFEPVLRTGVSIQAFEIVWRPTKLSPSFHGRDLFAPMAARLARGDRLGLSRTEPTRYPSWPVDIPVVVHVDRYGNAVTGLRAGALAADSALAVAGHRLSRVRTFSDVPPGSAFWYENSSGLVEIAANGSSAAAQLELVPGSPVQVCD